MGNVYLATAQGPGGFRKLVAIKELKPDLCDDGAYVAMFLDEAKLAARLIHPNVVQTNEVVSEGGRHYMVMEFLDGRSLHRIVKRLRAKLPLGVHLQIIADALLGLQYVHELCGFDGAPLGIVHRDISPLNILVTFDGQTKVLDFGIAKTIDSSLETRVGVLKGRLAYMAPEQAEGAKVDRRADIYSAGVMLWEAAAGRRLWPNMSEAQIFKRVLSEPAPSLRAVQPHAPLELDAICARAMARDPADRYAAAADLLRDLEAHLSVRPDAANMREIASFMAQSFAEERQAMHAVIEEALMRQRRGPCSGVVPTSLTQRIMLEGPHHAGHSFLTPSSHFGPYGATSPESALAATSTIASADPTVAERHSWAGRATRLTMGTGALLLMASLFGAPLPAGESRASTAAAASAVTPALPSGPAFATPTTIANDDARGTGAQTASPFGDAAPHPAQPAPALRHTGSPRLAPPVNCQPPYVIDPATGKKRWRLECL
jgi:serine/threonine-protein kinase